MRKQELIHVHELLAAIAEECQADTQLDLEAYLSLGTYPTSINQSKTAHKEAIYALSTSIRRAVQGEAVDQPQSAHQPQQAS